MRYLNNISYSKQHTSIADKVFTNINKADIVTAAITVVLLLVMVPIMLFLEVNSSTLDIVIVVR